MIRKKKFSIFIKKYKTISILWILQKDTSSCTEVNILDTIQCKIHSKDNLKDKKSMQGLLWIPSDVANNPYKWNVEIQKKEKSLESLRRMIANFLFFFQVLLVPIFFQKFSDLFVFFSKRSTRFVTTTN